MDIRLLKIVCTSLINTITKSENLDNKEKEVLNEKIFKIVTAALNPNPKTKDTVLDKYDLNEAINFEFKRESKLELATRVSLSILDGESNETKEKVMETIKPLLLSFNSPKASFSEKTDSDEKTIFNEKTNLEHQKSITRFDTFSDTQEELDAGIAPNTIDLIIQSFEEITKTSHKTSKNNDNDPFNKTNQIIKAGYSTLRELLKLPLKRFAKILDIDLQTAKYTLDKLFEPLKDKHLANTEKLITTHLITKNSEEELIESLIKTGFDPNIGLLKTSLKDLATTLNLNEKDLETFINELYVKIFIKKNRQDVEAIFSNSDNSSYQTVLNQLFSSIFSFICNLNKRKIDKEHVFFISGVFQDALDKVSERVQRNKIDHNTAFEAFKASFEKIFTETKVHKELMTQEDLQAILRTDGWKPEVKKLKKEMESGSWPANEKRELVLENISTNTEKITKPLLMEIFSNQDFRFLMNKYFEDLQTRHF